MATLTGQQIDQSYQGLIKTSDNAALNATPKAIQDGTGGATNIEMSNTATNFVSGTVDFTGSTVSGLPGGSAGLENGTGTDSLQSAASLTTNPANAAGNGSIAIGDGASATRQESVAIGQGAEANGSGSEGSIAIGHGSIASSNRGIAIGINGTTNSSEGIVIGDDVDISGSDRSVAIGGAINISGGSDKVAIGTSASVTGNRGLAFGQNASATANEAIAIGYNVTAATANTLSVNALETQSDGGVNIKGDGTNAGKLKLYCEDASGAHNVTLEGPAHAGGSTYSLKFPNVQSAGSQILEADSSGNLSWIDTPSGGGGAAPAYGAYGGNGMRGVIPRANSATQSYRTWITTTGYGTSQLIKDDKAQYAIIGVQAGDTISEVQIGIQTPIAGGTVEIAFYDVDVDSYNTLYIKDRLLSLGSVSAATSGSKTITLGTPFTMPSGKVNSQIAVLVFPSTAGIGITNWSQATWNGAGGDPAGTTVYRAMGLIVEPNVAMGTALPASIGPIGTTGVQYGSETNGALWLLYK